MKIRTKSIHNIALILFSLGTIFYFMATLIIVPLISPDPLINTFPNACPHPNNCTRIADTNNRENGIAPPILNANTTQVRQAIIQWLGPQLILNKTATFIHIKWIMPLTRFVDDVFFLLTPNSNNQTVVWIQSQSRIGSFDFNTNTNRVNGFLEFLASYNF